MRIVTVLRSGGDFKAVHVQTLQRQCAKFLPACDFVCLADVDVPGVERWPIETLLPGWWAKMNLFAPAIRGDILYMDLDTVLIGTPDVWLESKPIMLRDFYRDGVYKGRAEGLQSSVMFLPEHVRGEIYDAFMGNPIYHMQHFQRGGDQAFLEQYWLDKADRWQVIAPGQFVSWKVHCQNGVPPDAKIIIFHGQPRPWHVPQFKDLYGSDSNNLQDRHCK